MAVIRAGLLLGAIAAASFGLLLVALPQPSHGDRVAIGVLDRLQQTRFRGGVLRLGGRTLPVWCTRHHRSTSVLELATGERLRVRNQHVVVVRDPARELASDTRAAVDPLPAAVADLAGTQALYVSELVGRLLAGKSAYAGTGVVDGRPVYLIRLGDRPSVELLVDRRTGKPVGARFDSSRAHGTSRLLLTVSRTGC